jgi:hypothetical protein
MSRHLQTLNTSLLILFNKMKYKMQLKTVPDNIKKNKTRMKWLNDSSSSSRDQSYVVFSAV